MQKICEICVICKWCINFVSSLTTFKIAHIKQQNYANARISGLNNIIRGPTQVYTRTNSNKVKNGRKTISNSTATIPICKLGRLSYSSRKTVSEGKKKIYLVFPNITEKRYITAEYIYERGYRFFERRALRRQTVRSFRVVVRKFAKKHFLNARTATRRIGFRSQKNVG